MAAPTWDEILRDAGVDIHPAATLFPLGSLADLDALAASIERGGVRQALRLWRETESDPWQLLDGRRRCAAMGRLPDGEEMIKGALAMAERHIGGNPLDLVEDLNNERRHMSLEDRRVIAAKLLAMDPTRSDRAVAKQVGLSHTTIANVRMKGEGRGQIGHVDTHTDTKGRRQSATKPPPPKPAAPTSNGVDIGGVWHNADALVELVDRALAVLFPPPVMKEMFAHHHRIAQARRFLAVLGVSATDLAGGRVDAEPAPATPGPTDRQRLFVDVQLALKAEGHDATRRLAASMGKSAQNLTDIFTGRRRMNEAVEAKLCAYLARQKQAAAPDGEADPLPPSPAAAPSQPALEVPPALAAEAASIGRKVVALAGGVLQLRDAVSDKLEYTARDLKQAAEWCASRPPLRRRTFTVGEKHAACQASTHICGYTSCASENRCLAESS